MILKLFLLTERFSVGKHTHSRFVSLPLMLASMLISFVLFPLLLVFLIHINTQNDSLKRFLKIDAHLSISYQNVLNKATTTTTTTTALTTAEAMRCSWARIRLRWTKPSRYLNRKMIFDGKAA